VQSKNTPAPQETPRKNNQVASQLKLPQPGSSNVTEHPVLTAAISTPKMQNQASDTKTSKNVSKLRILRDVQLLENQGKKYNEKSPIEIKGDRILDVNHRYEKV
jgi:hypothetical protein